MQSTSHRIKSNSPPLEDKAETKMDHSKVKTKDNSKVATKMVLTSSAKEATKVETKDVPKAATKMVLTSYTKEATKVETKDHPRVETKMVLTSCAKVATKMVSPVVVETKVATTTAHKISVAQTSHWISISVLISLDSNLLSNTAETLASTLVPQMDSNNHPNRMVQPKVAPNNHPSRTDQLKVAPNNHPSRMVQLKVAPNTHPSRMVQLKVAPNNHPSRMDQLKVVSNSHLMDRDQEDPRAQVLFSHLKVVKAVSNLSKPTTDQERSEQPTSSDFEIISYPAYIADCG